MRAWRSALAAGVVLAVSATVVSAAGAATPVWVALNAGGKAAVVTQPSEIPSWFSPVRTVAAPHGGGSDYVGAEAICPQYGWETRTRDQGSSLYEVSGATGPFLSSTLYQYTSTAAARRAWTRLVTGAARCPRSGTATEEGDTFRFVTRVGTLPPMYGGTGITVFASTGPSQESPASWMYTTYRTMGNAILSTRFSDEVTAEQAAHLGARRVHRHRRGPHRPVGESLPHRGQANRRLRADPSWVSPCMGRPRAASALGEMAPISSIMSIWRRPPDPCVRSTPSRMPSPALTSRHRQTAATTPPLLRARHRPTRAPSGAHHRRPAGPAAPARRSPGAGCTR